MIILNKSDRLLFQGDSITHGGRGENQWDKNHVLGHGYPEMLAGRLLFENRTHLPQIINRGVSGDSTKSLLARWDTDTLALRPTALSLLVGVNNCHTPHPDTAENYFADLCALLEQTKSALPDVKLIVCEPFAFPPPEGAAGVSIAACAACAEKARLAADRFGAVFVPFWKELEAYVNACPPGSVIWDGVHPTTLGHEIMARFWYGTVEASGLFAD